MVLSRVQDDVPMPAMMRNATWWAKDVYVEVVLGEHSNQRGVIEDVSADGASAMVELEKSGRSVSIPVSSLVVRSLITMCSMCLSLVWFGCLS